MYLSYHLTNHSQQKCSVHLFFLYIRSSRLILCRIKIFQQKHTFNLIGSWRHSLITSTTNLHLKTSDWTKLWSFSKQFLSKLTKQYIKSCYIQIIQNLGQKSIYKLLSYTQQHIDLLIWLLTRKWICVFFKMFDNYFKSYFNNY